MKLEIKDKVDLGGKTCQRFPTVFIGGVSVHIYTSIKALRNDTRHVFTILYLLVNLLISLSVVILPHEFISQTTIRV